MASGPSARRLSPRRYALFAIASVSIAVFVMLVGLLAVDVWLHWKYERTASVNIWGYRGPTVGRKQPGETRVVVLGGSAAFGYGPNWDGSFPYLLEQRLNAMGQGRFSVVNLAYNNESAYSFRYTLEDYRYLQYDIAILYEGYNDGHIIKRYQVYRRGSPVFRLTGYLPIFPTIFREKAFAMLYGGDINRGYRGDTAVFTPGLATRATAGALQTAASTAQAIERQLGRLTKDVSAPHTLQPTTGCSDRWQHYCSSVYEGIVFARNRGAVVLVGTQPFISDEHIDQQNALVGLLQQRFHSEPDVRHVNLGAAVDLKNEALSYDGMHLTPAGNQIIADGFVQPVLESARRIAARRRGE